MFTIETSFLKCGQEATSVLMLIMNFIVRHIRLDAIGQQHRICLEWVLFERFSWSSGWPRTPDPPTSASEY